MFKRYATDEHPAPAPWLLLVALLLLPAIGLLAPAAQAGDDEPTDTATEEEAPAEEEVRLPWVVDVAAAKKQAAAEDKDLFINFTGSDWCGWCKRLDAEVFDHAEFIDAATKRFVFLFLDFPNDADLKAKVVDPDLNKELSEAYGVGGFPTIILATADGTPYARTGYQAGGPAGYLEHLAGFKANSEAMAKLVADTNHEDVDALKAAFPFIVEHEFLGWPSLEWTLDAAEKADPKGELGMLSLVKEERQRRLAKTEWDEFAKLLPKSRQEELDLDTIVPAMLALEHQKGHQFFGLAMNLATAAGQMGKAEQANKLIDMALPGVMAMQAEGGPQFLQLAINSSMALVSAERAEEAKKIVDSIADDPFFKKQANAQRVLDQVKGEIEKALAGPSEEEEDDDDDDGEDHEDDEDEGHDDDDDDMGGDE